MFCRNHESAFYISNTTGNKCSGKDTYTNQKSASSNCGISLKCRVDFANQLCCPNHINIYTKMLTLHENPIDNAACKILLFFPSAFGLLTVWPSDVIWRLRSGSTLAQVKTCCLTAPIHYPNQCWLIINMVHWHSYEGSFTRDTSATDC